MKSCFLIKCKNGRKKVNFILTYFWFPQFFFLHSNVFTSYHHNITFIIVFGSASGYIYFICSFSLNYMQVSKTLLKNYGGLPKYCSVSLIHVLIPRYYDKVLILRKCFVYLLFSPRINGCPVRVAQSGTSN